MINTHAKSALIVRRVIPTRTVTTSESRAISPWTNTTKTTAAAAAAAATTSTTKPTTTATTLAASTKSTSHIHSHTTATTETSATSSAPTPTLNSSSLLKSFIVSFLLKPLNLLAFLLAAAADSLGLVFQNRFGGLTT
jgi:hypothetical protein